jgi:hypothetical protein
MLRALNPYIDYVQRLQARTSDVHVEERVKIGNGALVWGTADCAALDGEDLYIADLKYGKGVPVEPDSAQLKIYACAAIDTLWRRRLVSTVTLTVVQPRLDPVPKSVRFDMDVLIRWAEDELNPAMRRILRGDEREKVGPYCRWCVRKQECQSFANYKSSMAADIFDDGVDLSDA